MGTVNNVFINFLLAAEKDRELFDEFLRIKEKKEWDAKSLHEFFASKNYEIPEDDCQGIIEFEKNITSALHMAGEAVVTAADCAGGHRGY